MLLDKAFRYPDTDHRKPPVPKPDDYPVMGLRTTKNFITENAVHNILAVPKKPEKTYVDTRNGAKHSLIPSGLEPVFINKKVCESRDTEDGVPMDNVPVVPSAGPHSPVTYPVKSLTCDFPVSRFADLNYVEAN